MGLRQLGLFLFKKASESLADDPSWARASSLPRTQLKKKVEKVVLDAARRKNKSFLNPTRSPRCD